MRRGRQRQLSRAWWSRAVQAFQDWNHCGRSIELFNLLAAWIGRKERKPDRHHRDYNSVGFDIRHVAHACEIPCDPLPRTSPLRRFDAGRHLRQPTFGHILHEYSRRKNSDKPLRLYGKFFSSLSGLRCIMQKTAGINFRQLHTCIPAFRKLTSRFCSSNCTQLSFLGTLNVTESTRSASPFLDWGSDTARMTFDSHPRKGSLYSLYCYSKTSLARSNPHIGGLIEEGSKTHDVPESTTSSK